MSTTTSFFITHFYSLKITGEGENQSKSRRLQDKMRKSAKNIEDRMRNLREEQRAPSTSKRVNVTRNVTVTRNVNINKNIHHIDKGGKKYWGLPIYLSTVAEGNRQQ
jgi:hypothetical protein